jgi:hypothetical protein
MFEMNKNVRNAAIVLVIAALVVLLPGGGSGAQVAIQAVSLAFLGTGAWIASRLYREHRVSLYSLGDRRRATLYGAVAVVTLTLTATPRLWQTGTGEIVWFALLGGSAYAAFAVVWSARKY